jgi:7,8-dihydropterin-6-yl-methyl-4-(beta-D-ribofuranosyl)aminobenzene 5'-phosphate synthase
MKRTALWLWIVLVCCLWESQAQTPGRITVLYDGFGKSAVVRKDWGFAALIEYGGKRVLFDTGNNADIFAENVKGLGVDLRSLDFVVVSHRHSDHASGLNYLLQVNPDVKIYVPNERFEIFGGSISPSIYRDDPSLRSEMRYFDGKPPQQIRTGSPWPQAHFVPVDQQTEVIPGFYLIPSVSQVPGTLELRELSLAVRTPKGLLLVVGCSHAGIEVILHSAAAIDPRFCGFRKFWHANSGDSGTFCCSRQGLL